VFQHLHIQTQFERTGIGLAKSSKSFIGTVADVDRSCGERRRECQSLIEATPDYLKNTERHIRCRLADTIRKDWSC
jgi:hypothetical protein